MLHAATETDKRPKKGDAHKLLVVFIKNITQAGDITTYCSGKRVVDVLKHTLQPVIAVHTKLASLQYRYRLLLDKVLLLQVAYKTDSHSQTLKHANSVKKSKHRRQSVGIADRGRTIQAPDSHRENLLSI
jgi:hypothetical protein